MSAELPSNLTSILTSAFNPNAPPNVNVDVNFNPISTLKPNSTFNLTSTLNPTYPESDIPQYVGFICCGICSIMFGTNLLPVKKFETGDGMFFQFVFSTAVAVCGLVIQIVRRSTFHPYAMLGGLLWATGNLFVVPAVKTIGLGLGLGIWSSVQLLVGWANGRFGIIGIDAEVPPHVYMNYGGVVLSLISTVMYVFVRPEIKPVTTMELTVVSGDDEDTVEKDPKCEIISNGSANKTSNETANTISNGRANNILSNGSAITISNGSANKIITNGNALKIPNSKRKASEDRETTLQNELSYVDKLSPVKKNIVGVCFASTTGVLFAFQFVPSIHIQESERENGASQSSIDYVFAHYTGIHLSASIYFVLYAIYMKNRPKVYPRAMIPALISGVMWSIGNTSWFIANRALSEPVTFPINSTLPTGISLVIGVLVFKEITGRRNMVLVVIAMAFRIAGAVVAAFSKV